MKRTTFVIVGLGLIGGSLAKALRRHYRAARVIGVSRSQRKINLAKKKRLIHEGTMRVTRVLDGADFVFVCTPVDTIARSISVIDREATRGTIVTDVGSTKRELMEWANRNRFKNIEFIGSHPLAGSHLGGLEYSKADLFEGARVLITPAKRSSREAKQRIASIWKRLGSSVHVVTPEEHDRIVSQISHLPHAVAALLVEIVSPRSLEFAASGFRDTTRIAQGDARLWTPIFLANRKFLIRDLKRFLAALRQLTRGLKKGSPKNVEQILARASIKRKQLQFRRHFT